MSASYQLLASPGVILRVADGAYIPTAPGNKDYQAYLAWAAAGNTADPVPVPSKPTSISPGEFLLRFTAAEQAAVQQACLASPQLMLGLTMGLALGTINLTGSNLATWMQGLVTAGALTSQRATAIATP